VLTIIVAGVPPMQVWSWTYISSIENVPSPCQLRWAGEAEDLICIPSGRAVAALNNIDPAFATTAG